MPKLDDYGPGNHPRTVPPRAVDGEAQYWSVDDLRKAFGGMAPSVMMGNFGWTPEYRLALVQRPYSPAATAPSEMHEDKTQIYFVLSGTGTQLLGGKPDKDIVAPEGQHSSNGPLTGARSYRIKPGDVVLIPPMAWHQTLADPGQTVTYHMVHIETRRRMP
jgi:mannose-6-phosphate isomerase-like protein (cupin superfamily)